MQATRDEHDTAPSSPPGNPLPLPWKDHAEPSQRSKTAASESPSRTLPTAKQNLVEAHEMLPRPANPPSTVATD